MQAAEASVELIVTRWRCRNPACPPQIFSGCLSELASSCTRRTPRVTRLVRLLAHADCGRPVERLTRHLGFPKSWDTLLRTLIQAEGHEAAGPRVLGIDDWAWRKGHAYGTIMINLKRHEVVDLLNERPAEETARRREDSSVVEIVVGDRCGLYAEGPARGGPASGGPVPPDLRPPSEHPTAIQSGAPHAIPVQSPGARACAVHAARFRAGPAQSRQHRWAPRSNPQCAPLGREAQIRAAEGPSCDGAGLEWWCDEPGWTAAWSANRPGLTPPRNGGARCLVRPARTPFAITSRAAGPRNARWGGSSSLSSENSDTPGA